MYYCVKFRLHIVAPPNAWGSWFEEICVYPTRECFHISHSFIGQWLFFFWWFVCLKWYYFINSSIKKYPLLPHPTLGVMVWTNVNLHYLRMIHSSDSLSGHYFFGKENFILCIPLKHFNRTLPEDATYQSEFSFSCNFYRY